MIAQCLTLSACGNETDTSTSVNDSSNTQSSQDSYSSSSSSNSSSSQSSKSYDYDKGYGYTEPKEGESFSDYVKRQDPDLYDSMNDRYDSAKSSSSSSSKSSKSYDYDNGYGYTEPKKGESFSDYVKRQDPELYNSMKSRLNSLS